jgi:succinate dehydrogenase/fumarate reductase-like Fe-S protein
MKFSYNKYKMPVHKDIIIVFNNIDKSYEKVREYIENNNMTFKEVSKIIKRSTKISNRIIIEKN